MQNALIIFAKNIVRGKVKTRIAATAGHDKALEIYQQLVHYTLTIAQQVHADKYIFYSDFLEQNNEWCPADFHKKVQQGKDLGKRMMQAFQQLFQKGYSKIVIIGSDCMELTVSIIQQAFEQLHDTDVVIGPASDGGYYLLGLTRMHSSLFNQIAWSTGKVLQQTLHACRLKNVTYYLLTELHDIDEEKDWEMFVNKADSAIR